MAEYPEHEKLANVKEDSQRLGSFIEWWASKGYRICEYVESEYRGGDDSLAPIHKSVNQWLAEFYEIDLNKIEEEKRQMLDEIRQANETARAIDEAARA